MCDQDRSQNPLHPVRLLSSASAAEEGSPEQSCLTVDTRGLAFMLGVSYSTITKLCAARAWRQGELPAPIYIGRRAATGDGSGARRWIASDVARWLATRAEVGP